MTAALSNVPTLGQRLWQSKIHVQRAIVALSGLSLTLLVFVQVVARYLFDASIYGLGELATFIAVWFYFLGGAIGAEQRMHISASLVDLVIRSEAAQVLIRVVAGLISVVLCAWMTWWGIGFAAWSLGMGMMSLELGFPIGYVHVAIPVGLGLMTVYLFVDLIEDVQRLRGRADG
jgi:TRAP-type C4-dicarboxylate transport system permease small subunit